jgi:hypothetical protein
MSRKWERKVARNSKLVNKQRKRFGQPPIGSAAAPVKNKDLFLGRSIVLPLLLTAIAVFIAVIYYRLDEDTGFTMLTVGLYVLLAVYFFLKRPYLAIQGSSLATRRLGRERTVSPNEIERIEIAKDYCLIVRRNKRVRWVFSRPMNRYDTEAMGKRLREYAAQHHIPVKTA